jgi:hypothetical protein
MTAFARHMVMIEVAPTAGVIVVGLVAAGLITGALV